MNRLQLRQRTKQGTWLQRARTASGEGQVAQPGPGALQNKFSLLSAQWGVLGSATQDSSEGLFWASVPGERGKNGGYHKPASGLCHTLSPLPFTTLEATPVA